MPLVYKCIAALYLFWTLYTLKHTVYTDPPKARGGELYMVSQKYYVLHITFPPLYIEMNVRIICILEVSGEELLYLLLEGACPGLALGVASAAASKYHTYTEVREREREREKEREERGR